MGRHGDSRGHYPKGCIGSSPITPTIEICMVRRYRRKIISLNTPTSHSGRLHWFCKPEEKSHVGSNPTVGSEYYKCRSGGIGIHATLRM